MHLQFIDTQQPLPYVHLLSVITDVALVINAVAVGIETGRSLGSTAHCEGTATPVCDVAIYHQSALNTTLLLALAVGRVVALTVFADGLLGIVR